MSRANRRGRRNVKAEMADLEMGKFAIDAGNSTGRYEGVYLDITNLLSNFPEVESLDRLPTRRYHGEIHVVMFPTQHRIITSFPACRAQLLEGPHRTSETIASPTLLVTEVTFHFPANDTRPTRLGQFARNRITKIHLFHIAHLFRATYCVNFVGRAESPTSNRPKLLAGGGRVAELATSYGGRIANQAKRESARSRVRLGARVIARVRLRETRINGG